MYHIRQMDRTYAGALLTIVADCGLDARSGLVGAKSGSRLPHQEVLAISDFAMVSGVTNLKSHLKYSPWNIRGWTLQEKILSRRCLVFGIDQVRWERAGDSWCEQTILERSDTGKSTPLRGFFAETGRQYQSTPIGVKRTFHQLHRDGTGLQQSRPPVFEWHTQCLHRHPPGLGA